jgi:hypothetical protein
MPVTIRLSTLLTQRLGEQAADELANWFNQVDATYRTDLRELNELNFARFDAKLEQRIAESTARLEAKFGALEVRIGALETMIGALELKFTELEERLGARMATAIAALRAELIKWMFLFWIGSVVTIVGAMSVLR